MGNYFNIPELCKSETAEKEGIANIPDENQIKNMKVLIKVLDIIREAWGKPIIVNSGFRCKELNNHPKIKGSKTSWHLKGMAADIRCSDNLALWNLIVKLQDENKIHFTELINEKADKKGNPRWIHIAVNPDCLKNQIKFIK